MKLTFLGGADEVGASCTLIEIAGKRLLVDAGIRISSRSNRAVQVDQLPDLHPIGLAGGPDYILVTHAHTDHTGALPLVVEQYPHVPVLATQPSVDLVRVLQSDAQQIMRSRQESEGELPLFDEIAVERLMDAFQIVGFNQSVHLGDGLQVTYFPAGHIVGAGTLLLESEEGTLMMSGDVSLAEQRAVVRASIPRVKVDALVLESTYGGRLHANRVAEEKRLIATLGRVVERGGKVLIPAFALGRAQEIVQIILAYRDQLDVPVYVDGMVRAVCRAYSQLAGWLPPSTVNAAREEPLFFRSGIKAILNTTQREEIARSEGPVVVVASSGMLTGGASVAYAQQFASDERCAIFLTGYQDEEAPGRVLQRVARQKAAGEETTLRLGSHAVTVRCEVDTYSLSAHADEGELVAIAESLEPEEIMLVHGDPGARHSLATRLRQRGRRVHLPKIAQEYVFSFAARPWGMGRVKAGQETRPLDVAELWSALKDSGGSYFSARELSQMWWGDPERAGEVVTALAGEAVFFAADWRQRDTFRVRTTEQIARTQLQREIMLEHPDLIGKVVVLRDSNDRPRVGVVVNATIDAFEAVVHNAKGRNYPGDALLWAVGHYDGPSEGRGMEARLAALVKEAQALIEVLLPYERRQELVTQGAPVNPEHLLPPQLPGEPMASLVAVVLGLASDGAVREQGGLLPRRAVHDAPMEQNQARDRAFAAFPPEARLRKVGIEPARQRLTLTFDFPDRAKDLYAVEIEQLIDQTGWQVVVNPSANQQALGSAIDELLPAGVRIVKGPAFYLDRREIYIQTEGPSQPESLGDAYEELTGFHLRVKYAGDKADTKETGSSAWASGAGERMEINSAYSLIRQALEGSGLYKTSLKQNQIVLSFISPQLGERCRDTIAQLSQTTGYTLSIHPHPNQQEILRIAQQLFREARWQVRKGPGIRTGSLEITASLTVEPDPNTLRVVTQKLENMTAYKLTIE